MAILFLYKKATTRLKKIVALTTLSSLIMIGKCQAAIVDSSQGCAKDGSCGLNDIMQAVIKAAYWIWGISGSLALLFFIYGGFTFLISGGESDKVNKGKEIIKNSLIGLVVIFVSYAIVNFIVTNVLHAQMPNPWFQLPSS